MSGSSWFPAVLCLALASQAETSPVRFEIPLSSKGAAGTWDGPLGAALVLTDDPRGFVEHWNWSGGGLRAPGSPTLARLIFTYRDTDRAKRGIPLRAVIFLKGCAADEAGRCRTVVRFGITAPDGHPWIEPQEKVLWDQAPPGGAEEIGLGTGALDIDIGGKDAPGAYTLTAEVLDRVSGGKVLLTRTFTAVEAGANELEGVDAEARSILARADRLELLSLDPDSTSASPSKGFHGYKILGKTVIDSEEERGRLFLALNQGNSETYAVMGSCFNPRHGLRASVEGRTADLVICFECLQVVAYMNGGEAGHFLTSATPQPVFDGLLRKAGVRLAKKPHAG